MLESLKIWKHQGKQFIPDLRKAKLPESFALGRPVISNSITAEEALLVAKVCPTQAILTEPFAIDLGRCVFCKECERMLGKDKIKFTNDYKTATNERSRLIVNAGENLPITLNADLIKAEIKSVFGKSLKLRQVSAGGDSSCEAELNAISNVNFDFGRFGIEFTASPRHADGVVITGPITENMAKALEICYQAIPNPKIVVLVGTDAISGGIFEGCPALNREFLDKYPIDLFVPGNPPHPLTFINGIMDLIGKK